MDTEFGEVYSSTVWDFNMFKKVFDHVEAECRQFQCQMCVINQLIIPTFMTIEEAVMVFDCDRSLGALRGFFRAAGEDSTDAWLSTYLRLHSRQVAYNRQRHRD